MEILEDTGEDAELPTDILDEKTDEADDAETEDFAEPECTLIDEEEEDEQQQTGAETGAEGESIEPSR